MPRYNPAPVETKWQAFWDEHHTFATPRLPVGEKMYVLDMFPYPSGDGLHVGHPEGYTATDIVCRAARMQGKSVLHPMGFDSFGLPAEEHAIKTGEHPRVQTEQNINTFRRQMKMLGFSYDWSREVATTDVEYFRWTQWIFLQLYDTWFDKEQQKGRPICELPIPNEVSAVGNDAVREYQDDHRLAYRKHAPVNWCPALGTVLANEEVIDGKSERGGHPVERRPLLQWMLRITAYADRLEKDLEGLDWSEGVKALQRNWIGRSTGAEVDFAVGEEVLCVYTTRPDTLFGATYMVIAPEHPLVEQLTIAENTATVKTYCDKAAAKSDLDRTELAKEKTGVFTGSYATNPVNGKPIPIWIADYVLISYGTGAIMAVPAHDERDFEFAKQFHIEIIPVVAPANGEDASECFTGEGVAINSGEYDGLSTGEFKRKITGDLSDRGCGREAVNYKLRDWLFSRQRFWGEPFPILHELDADGNKTGAVRAVPEDQLPVDLPHLDDFKPHGRPEPPLDKAPDEWLYPTIDGVRYQRETNMPQWAGSCWYYLRFLDPANTQAIVDPEIEKAWMPVDLYIGGAEHAVLHLLYARFWHKVLFDRGVISTPEPFQKLVNQGMILGSNNEKMSKSRGNVVNPDEVVKEYGADSLRLYEMFMGPLEQTKPWNMEGVNGVFGFLNRVWRMILDDKSEQISLNPAVTEEKPTEEQNRVLHKTIKAVTEDIAKLSLNTAIARMMEFTNFYTKQTGRPRAAMEQFVLLLSPFAPHIAEELWEALGHKKTLAYEPWPAYDEAMLVEAEIEIPVQIKGKVRAKIRVPADADQATIEALARADTRIIELLDGKELVKTIVVPGRMVNFVVKG
ncbi:MAG: leucine--tRNA ligase [Planctomycetes bacterium]|nr:leucine--tRNA ligase [Planctomycetota bacterium]